MKKFQSCVYLCLVYMPVAALFFMAFNTKIAAAILVFYAVIVMLATLAAVMMES